MTFDEDVDRIKRHLKASSIPNPLPDVKEGWGYTVFIAICLFVTYMVKG
jgi:hypothetical protein